MSPSGALAAINFFEADVEGGLGPFLATWLAGTAKWQPLLGQRIAKFGCRCAG